MNSGSWDLSRDQANELLRYGIGLLRGKHGWLGRPKERFLLAVSIRNQLKAFGFPNQARLLDSWLREFLRFLHGGKTRHRFVVAGFSTSAKPMTHLCVERWGFIKLRVSKGEVSIVDFNEVSR